MKNKHILYLALFALVLSSCSNWLDVKPKSMTEEEELFSREDGFKEALTGAYIRSARTDLYGTRLSLDFLDILAQRYNPVENGEQKFQDPSYYNFTNTNSLVSGTTAQIWQNMYEVIGNLNNLISWTDRNRNVFVTEGYYEIIRGEALALRSYLYFDLLRMYGPVYNQNPTAASVVYRTEYDRNIHTRIPANELLDHIIADLKTAEQLLEGHDTLDFDVNKFGADLDEDAFLIARFNRMNLMAVKALLARAYLYRGGAADREAALGYAREVVGSGLFSLAKSNNSDKRLSTEIIFGVYVLNFTEQVWNRINQTGSTMTGDWYISGREFYQALTNFEEDGMNDWRMNEITGFVTAGAGGGNYVFQKYAPGGAYGTSGTIPLIRLPEMYYIMTECEPDLITAGTYINQVRDSRGLQTIELTSETERLRQLELEYRKEFYGEGQLWYFYKRHFFTSFVNCPVPEMRPSNYIFPIPEAEISFGGLTE